MKLVIISPGYPNEINPAQNVFVRNLVEAIADLGNTCFVISPQNVLHKEMPLINEHRIDTTEKGNKIEVFFPKFRALWRQDKFPIDPIAKIGYKSFYSSVKKVIDSKIKEFDVIYSHFLFPAGVCAVDLKNEYSVKAFCAFGESSLWALGKYGFDEKIIKLSSLDGIIAVSSENKRRLIEQGCFKEDKIIVIPNAVNPNVFHPFDRVESRKYFNFSADDFIVSFVGGFSERKGVLRVAEALENIEDIKVAFAGKGELCPNITNQIFCSPIKPEEVPMFLSASDVFVLPTLNEGCCNAIVEAMACGKAIVSSNKPFNLDVLNENNSILINPEKIDEIRNAVLLLKDNPLKLSTLQKNALNDSKLLHIEHRAQRIINFITNPCA